MVKKMGLFKRLKDGNRIKLCNEKHVITDTEAGFEYEIDTAFRQTRSNAMEVEALSIYVSDGKENKQNDVPCVMVLTDSVIYEAIETYKEKGISGDETTCLEPLKGQFLYRAVTEYYGDMLYYYAFEMEKRGHKEKLGLCLEYPMEYAKTNDERVLKGVLDEVADSFKVINL